MWEVAKQSLSKARLRYLYFDLGLYSTTILWRPLIMAACRQQKNPRMHCDCQIISLFSQQQIQEVFKNQQEQLNIQLMQQKNAGMVNQEVGLPQYNNTLSVLLK